MTTTRSAVDRTSPSRWEMRIVEPPSRPSRRTKCEELCRDDGVEAGGRFVEDDEPRRPVGDGEGARDLHHLATGEGQVADDLARRDAVTREDRVERRMIRAPASRRQRRPRRCGWMMRAFSATVRLGQSDSSWKTQRTPSVMGRGPTGVGCTIGRRRRLDDALVGRQHPGQHVHERRLAGAVVADEADALADVDVQVDPAQGANCPKGLLDALEPCEGRAVSTHRGRSTPIAVLGRAPGAPSARAAPHSDREGDVRAPSR